MRQLLYRVQLRRNLSLHLCAIVIQIFILQQGFILGQPFNLPSEDGHLVYLQRAMYEGYTRKVLAPKLLLQART